jgi:hypothetical protein
VFDLSVISLAYTGSSDGTSSSTVSAIAEMGSFSAKLKCFDDLFPHVALLGGIPLEIVGT